jgi:pimeloyl-ACP methyl ester carboxylesterase
MPVKSAVLVSVGLLVLACGCSSSGADGDGGGQPAAANPSGSVALSTSTDAGAIDVSFDVGGHELQLTCAGVESPGSPTIIYLHGLGGDGGDVNEALAPGLEKRGRTCTYDRVNVGRSGHQDDTHTGVDSVADLHRLLTAAKVRPPYLMLGFSFGGLIAAMYAGTYPADVAGLLLLDSSLPTDGEVDATIPAVFRHQVVQEQQANVERVDFYGTLDEAKPLMDSVPDIPVTYLAARPIDLPAEWPVKRMRSLMAAYQQKFVAHFPEGRLVPVGSSHDIDVEHPGLVMAELDRMLNR